MTDYQRGLNDQPPEQETDWSAYNRGQADRAAGVLPTNSVTGGAAGQMRDEFRAGRIKFYLRWLAQTAGFSLLAALLGGGIAIVVGAPVGQWAWTAGSWTAIFCLFLLAVFTVGVLLGVAFNILTLPLLLWRWLLAFGALGAGAGYVTATMGNQSTTVVSRTAVDFGVLGLGAGLICGIIFHIYRRLRPRRSPS